jgi:molybdopterin/thiamine biosynthesis adenylyltransferase
MMSPPATEQLRAFLAEKAHGDLVSWPDQQEMMCLFQLDSRESEALILEQRLMPARYQRNRTMISVKQQLQLHNARVAVIGCGGLGGYILEELARLGVGSILAVDPDVFEEHNLNRQLLSTLDNLGESKVDAAVQRLEQVNPAVYVLPCQTAFDREVGPKLLKDVDLVLDAVDNVRCRMDLAAVCNSLRIPLVHAAIGGWFGQVATVYPGEKTLDLLYGNWNGGKGIEAQFGNPSFTPAVAASLQVTEACKVLLGEGETVRNGMLNFNLFDMQFEDIRF